GGQRPQGGGAVHPAGEVEGGPAGPADQHGARLALDDADRPQARDDAGLAEGEPPPHARTVPVTARTMHWHYHFPHVWEHPRYDWEDVWLRPDDPNCYGLAYNLTVQGLDNVHSPALLQSLREEVNARFWAVCEDDFHWEMTVRAADFSADELLDRVDLFL